MAWFVLWVFLEDSYLCLKLKELINFSSIQLVGCCFVGYLLFKLKFHNSSIPLALCQLHFELPNCSANSLLFILCMGGVTRADNLHCSYKPFIIFTRKHQQLFSVSGVATHLHCYLKLDHEGEISACHLLSHVFLFWRACSLLLEVNSPDLGRVLEVLVYVSVGLQSKYSVIQRYIETKIPIFWLCFFQFLFRYFLSPARWSTTELESVGVELWFCFWEFYQRNMDSTWLRLTSITKQDWPKMNRQVSS